VSVPNFCTDLQIFINIKTPEAIPA